MDQERYVAALEISSSKITGVIGRYDGQGQLTIEASEEESVKDSVRYGMIQNLEETAMRVSRIIDRLERNPNVAPAKVTGVYLCLSGRSLRSETVTASIQFAEENEVTRTHVDQLREDALRSMKESKLEVVDAIPRCYTVGKSETLSPVGALGREVTAVYDVIVCRPELMRNLQRVVEDKCGLKVIGFVVTSIAAGHLLLSNDEKRLGCMLVDMGAETTTVSIYYKGALRYFATLPLGGRNITRDLTSLSLLEEHAEGIKKTSGNAIARDTTSVNIDGLRYSDVSNYIVARAEEIVANVVEQIDYAQLKIKDLPAGIVCIGGGVRLNGMTELLSRQSGLPVRLGRLPEYIHLISPQMMDSDLLQTECVLYEGATQSPADCLETPKSEDLPATGEMPGDTDLPEYNHEEEETERRRKGPSKVSSFTNWMQNRISKLFANPEDSDSDLLD